MVLLHRPIRNEAVKSRKKAWLYVGIIVVLVLIFIAALLWGINHPYFKVKHINIEGVDDVGEEAVLGLVRNILDENYTLFIPKSNALFLPRDEIRQEIMQRDPRIEAVLVNLSGLESLSVHITKRASRLIYCKTTEDEDFLILFLEPCFFMDEDGTLFEEGGIQGGTHILVGKEDGVEGELGVTVMDEDTLLPALLFVEHALRDEDVSGVYITNDNDYVVVMQNGARIVFAQKQDIGKTVGGFLALLATLRDDASDNLGQSPYDAIEYFDLRFGKKIFYKKAAP